MELTPQQIDAARLNANIAAAVRAQHFTPAQRARMKRKSVPKLEVDFGRQRKQSKPASEKTDRSS